MKEDKIYNEIKDWFLNLYNSSMQKKDGDYINFYYDEDYIKRFKLYTIFGGDKPEFVYDKSDITFQQNLKIKWFWIKYDAYWSFLKSKYSLNYKQLKDITTHILNNNTICKQYTAVFIIHMNIF